jgi:hypothetical protein
MEQILRASFKDKFRFLFDGLSWFFFVRGFFRIYTGIVGLYRDYKTDKWAEQFKDLPDVPRTQAEMDSYVRSIMF